MNDLSGTANKVEQFRYGDRISSFRFSEVDILVPFHGQYTKVRELVESLLLFTKSNPYLITLVDDASPNAMFSDQIAKMAPIHVIRLREQRGFAGALKAGYDATVKPWVVFLHSDCRVNDHHWLQKLGETALGLKSQNVRLVHARTDNPGLDHPILVPTRQEDRQADRVVDTDDPLPLICAMVHRELFNRIGGFLREYPLAGYEDMELFYRMRRHGMKQGVCGGSWVHHEGGATVKEVLSHNRHAKQIMEQNYDRCMTDLSVR